MLFVYWFRPSYPISRVTLSFLRKKIALPVYFLLVCFCLPFSTAMATLMHIWCSILQNRVFHRITKNASERC